MGFSFPKNALHFTLLFTYVNSVNIFFAVARLGGAFITRPVIIYDYILVAIMIILRVPAWICSVAFMLIFLSDLITQISATYLFNLHEFTRNLEFFFLYELSAWQYLLIFAFVLLGLLNFWLIRRLLFQKFSPRAAIALYAGFFALVYSIDTLNGKSLLSNHQRLIAVSDIELGGSSVRYLAIALVDFNMKPQPPREIEKSVTFKTFENDTTGNQLLIIVESWGLPVSARARGELQKLLADSAKAHHWDLNFGSSPFKGGTTHGELRELLNVSGDYRYFLDPVSSKQFKSIFDTKRSQGYSTVALHSFSNKMFQRSVWWRNIGIDSVYFVEDVVRKNRLANDQLDYTTPFAALRDETALDFLISAQTPSKKFAYFLTVNTHLPFYAKANAQIFETEILSEEGHHQARRIVELLVYFFAHLDRSQWSKVVLVGDHIPPFSKSMDRGFYSSTSVPYVLLY